MSAENEAFYPCPLCGEEIGVPVDPSAGESQQYVEDCPVCCSPVILRVDLLEGGGVSISAEAE